MLSHNGRGHRAAGLEATRGQRWKATWPSVIHATLGGVERSVQRTTQIGEQPVLADEERAARGRRVAERLRRPDGLDRDALARIEKLTSDEH